MNIHFRRVWLQKIFPLRISRGVSKGSENLFVFVERDGRAGLGELAGTNTPDGENCDTGMAELGRLVESGLDGLSVHEVYARGREMGVRPRALAALDMALWDLLAKQAGMPLYRMLGLPLPTVATSVTIGIETPEVVRERVPVILRRSGAKHLKIKLGSPEGLEADRSMFEMVRDGGGALRRVPAGRCQRRLGSGRRPDDVPLPGGTGRGLCGAAPAPGSRGGSGATLRGPAPAHIRGRELQLRGRCSGSGRPGRRRQSEADEVRRGHRGAADRGGRPRARSSAR